MPSSPAPPPITDQHLERIARVLLHHPGTRALAEACGAEGVAAHLVGGILRDRLLGLPSHDVDCVVERRGEAVAGRVASALEARLVHLGGQRFGAYRIVGGGLGERAVLDIWDRDGTTLLQDLERRDFTVNAVALSVPDGALVDPLGGIADLRARRLRAATPESFSGDPLRVLRLARLLARLPGFSVGPGTLALARASSPALTSVASERVRDELGLAFAQADAHRALATLGTLDLYPGLWLGEPGEPGPWGSAVDRMARLGSTALDLRRLVGGRVPVRIDHRLARTAITFLSLPPSRDPFRALERLLQAGYLTRSTAAGVETLMRHREIPASGRRRFLHALGEEHWATAACLAGALAPTEGAERGAWERGVTRLATLVAEEGERLFDPPRLLDGNEVAEILDIEPGPAVGRALAALREAQIDGSVEDRGDALGFVRRLRRLT